MKYNIIESNYDEYIKFNGERCINTPYAKSIKNNECVYYMIKENDKFITDFCVFEKEDNEINLNILLKMEEVLDDIVMFFKGKYKTIKLRMCLVYDLDIEKRYNVSKKVLVNEKLELYDFFINL